jgi:hypothetical protein
MNGAQQMEPGIENQFDLSHWAGHIVSLFALTGSLFGIIPAIAGVAALVWYIIQIVESRTVQEWLRKRNARKIVRLQAELAALEVRQAAVVARGELQARADMAEKDIKAAARSAVADLKSTQQQKPLDLSPGA